METLLVISNVLLTLFTAAYVILTFRILVTTNRALKSSQDEFAQTNLIGVHPFLSLALTRRRNDVYIIVRNSSDLPATDVEVTVIGTYAGEDRSVSDFKQRFVQPKYQTEEWTPTSEDFYGVADSVIYYLFAPRQQVCAQLAFPDIPDTAYVFLQYRDVVGRNFLRIYWVFRERPQKDAETYRVGSIDPASLIPMPRVEDFRDSKVPSLLKGLIAAKPLTDAIDMYNHSIAAGFTIAPYAGPEDRGEWSGLSFP